MKFLLHGPVTPACAEALRRHEHTPVTEAEANITPGLDPAELVKAAHRAQLDLLTADREVAQFVRTQAVNYDRSLVYLQLTGEDVEQDDAIDRLFARYKRLKPRMIYTLTETQVKVQQMKR